MLISRRTLHFTDIAHSASSSLLIPSEKIDKSKVLELFDDDLKSDPLFEYVYLAVESYSTGEKYVIVCFHISNPEWTLKSMGIPKTLTKRVRLSYEVLAQVVS